MPYMEDVREFVERQGGRPVKIGEASWLLPSGASVQGYDWPITREPPANDFERLTLQKRYWRLKVERAEKDFAQLRRALLGERDHFGLPVGFQWPEDEYGPGNPDGLAALRQLQAVVKERRAKLREVEQQRAATPEAKQKAERERAARETERQRRADELERRDAVNKVRI